MKFRKPLLIGSTLVVAVAALSFSTQAKPATKTAVAKKATSKVAMATGTWNIDPMHSQIGFAVRHVLINDVHGTFDDFHGTIIANGYDVAKSSVEFSAKVASIDTHVKQRDDHLRSPDFFDAAKYPELKFKSIRIVRVRKDPNSFVAHGYFTMHGVTKAIAFPFEVSGPVVDGFGFTRGGIKAKFDIDRQEYGVKWNQVLDNGGLAVGNIVHVNLELEAVKAGTGPKKPMK